MLHLNILMQRGITQLYVQTKVKVVYNTDLGGNMACFLGIRLRQYLLSQARVDDVRVEIIEGVVFFSSYKCFVLTTISLTACRCTQTEL